MQKAKRYSTIISTLALVPYLAGTDLASSAPPAVTIPLAAMQQDGQAIPVKTRPGYPDGHYTGSTYDAYYGRVQTRVNVKGGQIVSVDVLAYPNHTGTSRYINSQALPMLERKVVRAQDVRVNLVSGATLTSEAYLRSVNSALAKAGN